MEGCKTRFFHNYKVEQASSPDATRQYYKTTVPVYIEVTDHVFVDSEFCEWVQSEFALNK